ncbi:alpha/beta hydrolase [Nocardioides carbamazepini]|uniref:alpha/beta hydrolase n=1 Tax=Nocardioides carbamazepini TaxID=2854259 RepID=UPI002149F91A|nr:alpha/beta hydrolase [Nocardioides carbamazepini]MCR1781268.1 alpha/beta hydrolase [Nocardioides carbamazepini]
MIDKSTQLLLEAIAQNRTRPLVDSSPAEARAAGAGAWVAFGRGPEMYRVFDKSVPARDGATFPVRIFVPSSSSRGVVVYFHGGGFVLGEIDGYDTLARTLAAAANTTVILVGYRLAPEHPFPVPVDDAWDAFQWAASELTDVPGIAGRWVVAGDSAGGNLAINTALRAADAGREIAAALLVYPVTDTDVDRPSYVDPQNQLLITRDSMRWFLDHYLGATDRSDLRASPLRVDDLAGFPPTAMVLAEHDPLLDEGTEFAARLRSAGVPVQLRLFDGQMHAFFQMVNVLPASNEAIEWLAAYLRNAVFTNRQEVS